MRAEDPPQLFLSWAPSVCGSGAATSSLGPEVPKVLDKVGLSHLINSAGAEGSPTSTLRRSHPPSQRSTPRRVSGVQRVKQCPPPQNSSPQKPRKVTSLGNKVPQSLGKQPPMVM